MCLYSPDQLHLENGGQYLALCTNYYVSKFQLLKKRSALPKSESFESKQIYLNPTFGFYHLFCQKVLEDLAYHSRNFYIDLGKFLSCKSHQELHQPVVVIFFTEL